MAAADILKAKVSALATATLKDMAAKLMRDTREGSETVLSAVLDVLMHRLPEAEFVGICENLE